MIFKYILEVGSFKRAGKIYNKHDLVICDRSILKGKPLVHYSETPIISHGRPVHPCDRLVQSSE